MADLPRAAGGQGVRRKKSLKRPSTEVTDRLPVGRQKNKKQVEGDGGIEVVRAPEYRSDAAIFKSNEIIQAKYNLPLNAHRIVTLYLSHLPPKAESFPFIKIPVSQIMEVFPNLNSNKRAAEQLEAAVDTLWRSEVTFHRGDDWIKCRWAVTAKRVRGDIYLRLNDDLLPQLANLVDRFTVYKMRYVIRLGTAYQYRLYEFLRSQLFMGRTRILFADLKSLMGIEPGSYENYGHFWFRILKPALASINQVTDIEVRVGQVLKDQKRKIGWVFEIRTNKQEQLDLSLMVTPVVERLIANGIGVTEATALANQHDADYLNQKMEFAEYEHGEGRVQSLPGFLRKAIENDWSTQRQPKAIRPKLVSGKKRPTQSLEDAIREERDLTLQAQLTEQRKKLARQFCAKKGMEQYKHADGARRAEIDGAFDKWIKSRRGAALVLYQQHGMSEPMVQHSFEGFLIAYLRIPEPSDDDLQTFVSDQIEPLGPELEEAPPPDA